MNANDPVFPCPNGHATVTDWKPGYGNYERTVEVFHSGMTIRAEFARTMMHAIMSDYAGLKELQKSVGDRWLEAAAGGACKAADALIAALAKNGGGK